MNIISTVSSLLFFLSGAFVSIRYSFGYSIYSYLSRHDVKYENKITSNKFGVISFGLCVLPAIISIFLRGFVSNRLLVFILFLMPIILFFVTQAINILSTTVELQDKHLIINQRKNTIKIPITNIKSVYLAPTDIPNLKCLCISTYDSTFKFSELDFVGIYDMYCKLKSLIEIE